MPQLTVPLAQFLESVELATGILKRKRQAKAVFAFRDGLLSIKVANSSSDVPAEGDWPGVATCSAWFLLKAIDPPPKANPVTITCNDGRLSIERVTTACEWRPERQKAVRLPRARQSKISVATSCPTAPLQIEPVGQNESRVTLSEAKAALDRVAARAALLEVLRGANVTSAIEKAAEQLADGAEYGAVLEGLQRVFRVEVYKRRLEKDLIDQTPRDTAMLQGSNLPKDTRLNMVDEDVEAADEFDPVRAARIRDLQAKFKLSDEEGEELSSLLNDRAHDARDLGAAARLIDVLDRHGVSLSTGPDEVPDDIKKSICDELDDDPFSHISWKMS